MRNILQALQTYARIVAVAVATDPTIADLSAIVLAKPRKAKRPAHARGFVFWRGTSRIDGAPLVAIATFGSKNAKTGSGLLQTWIMREDIAPHDAVRDGRDVSVCGSCIVRPLTVKLAKVAGLVPPSMRSCYVKTFQAPLSVFRAYHRGRYPTIDTMPQNMRDRVATLKVRVGSYGNPSVVPFEAWRDLIAVADRIGTGYDHLWRDADPRFASILMASVNSETEAHEAHARGYRTFRSRKATDPILANEMICPASKEAGKRLTCDRCLACAGNPASKDTARVRSVVIIEH